MTRLADELKRVSRAALVPVRDGMPQITVAIPEGANFVYYRKYYGKLCGEAHHTHYIGYDNLLIGVDEFGRVSVSDKE